MAQRQRAGLITPRSQDQNLLPVFIIRSFQNCQAVTTATLHRRGAEVARAAHNRKDIRSKRIVGIFQFAVFRTAKLSPQQHFTGMAQRQRAGLITPRTLDRNGLPVFSNSQFSELPSCHHSNPIISPAWRRGSARGS